MGKEEKAVCTSGSLSQRRGFSNRTCFVVVHVADATGDDMRKVLTQFDFTSTSGKPYEVISICSTEGCALQMKAKHVILLVQQKAYYFSYLN